ncbi:hypothetical protein niasHT_034891 [Heterodera trifolii]|uniref:Uncharacterized protein n=1 Tax=Heterodera trifolii TaxID=157864 RepID=A0ABD2I206_9BILA
MTSLNTTAPTNFELFLLSFGSAIELITTFVGIPLSIANLVLVARTSVIHPNMKAILIFQSFFILLRGSCRFVICLFTFISGDESVQFFPALRKTYLIGIYTRNFVLHVLVVERILATLFVRTYEKQRGHLLFTIVWTPFALIISIYIAFSTSSQSDDNQPITNLITTAVQLVIGSTELGIFYQICRYNSKLYQKMFQTIGSNNLSIRYQLSENIRVGKQLIPPLSLISISNTAPSSSAVNGIAQRNLISGKALIDNQTQPEDHFVMLKEAWEKGPMKCKNAISQK